MSQILLSLFGIGVHLCISYGIDQREFGENFFAYCANNLNGAEPTESTIDDFERKELINNKAKSKSNAGAKVQRSINDFEYDEIGSDGEDNDVMGAYICTTPKVNEHIQICLWFFCVNFNVTT